MGFWGNIKEMWNDPDTYDKWSDKKENSIILSNQEPIYLGITVAIMFAVISYFLELITLILTDYFQIQLNQYIILTGKIIILLIILAIYLHHIQFLQYKKSKAKKLL